MQYVALAVSFDQSFMELTTAILVSVVGLLASWTIKAVLLWILCKHKNSSVKPDNIAKQNVQAPPPIVTQSQFIEGGSKYSSGASFPASKLSSDDEIVKDFRSNDLLPEKETAQKEEDDSNAVYTERKKDLLRATSNGTAEELSEAIEWAICDGCRFLLKDEIYEARIAMKRQLNLARMRESIHCLRPSLISELRSYSKPPKVIYDVMLCVYLLLGERSENKLKTWSCIQALMSQNGRNSLKRLIERTEPYEVNIAVVARVKTILSSYDFQQIYDASEGAAAFYVWIVEMMADVERTAEEDA